MNLSHGIPVGTCEGAELVEGDVIREQLERIAGSVHFRNSKRYPAFLRYVVEHALLREGEALKERTIGAEVFHRANDYDTSADPIVRITAGEIRKRLAQYYQAPEHAREIRIELPLGTYSPQFVPSAELEPIEELREKKDLLDDEAAKQPAEPQHSNLLVTLSGPQRRAFKWWRHPYLIAACVILVFGMTFAVSQLRVKQTHALEAFWAPLLSPDTTLLLVIGTHSLDGNGHDLAPERKADETAQDGKTMLAAMVHKDMIPIEDAISYANVVGLLVRQKHAFNTHSATATDFEQIQMGPVFLMGAFDNAWTLRLTSSLPYSFRHGQDGMDFIIDRANPSVSWSFDNSQSIAGNSRDYAVVAGFFDSAIQQRVLIAAGIGKNGTSAAVDFVTTEKYLAAWRAMRKSIDSNFEIVLATDIVDGQQGPPVVLRSSYW